MNAGTTFAPFRSVTLVGCALALVAVTSLPGAEQQGGRPSQKAVSKELKQLHDDDQKDQNDPTWDASNDAAFSARQKLRRDRVMEIVESGMLASMEDWGHAALLLQHGQTTDDILLAHVLSVPPGIADEPFARFLCAATLDRFLQGIGRAQVFTTQSGAPDPGTYMPLEPFDDSMSQAVRELFALPPLPAQQASSKTQDRKSGGASAKELPKLLEQAQADAGKDLDAPAWLLRTREIVLGGTLKSDKDFDAAAQILLVSKEPEDLLSAHVLAMCAAFKSKKGDAPRILCAHTLDRFLLSIGKPQRFDTVQESGTPLEPRRPVQEFIQATYGTGKGRKAQ